MRSLLGLRLDSSTDISQMAVDEYLTIYIDYSTEGFKSILTRAVRPSRWTYDLSPIVQLLKVCLSKRRWDAYMHGDVCTLYLQDVYLSFNFKSHCFVHVVCLVMISGQWIFRVVDKSYVSTSSPYIMTVHIRGRT